MSNNKIEFTFTLSPAMEKINEKLQDTIMGNKINKKLIQLKSFVEINEALSTVASTNETAAKMISKNEHNIAAMAGSILRKSMEVQTGAKERGLTLSPVNEIRMPAKAVQRFLFEVNNGRMSVSEFSFYDDDDNFIDLNEMDIDWLYRRLQVDTLEYLFKHDF